ncbi:sigma-54-dependent Fis family transcriptional regulator [Aromatoleum toluclasticum]|uniref:sigma-54-dependent Fis family transcriptional regulator n=1 Tax=Aromatoleum toluclasticum TaxID=92003 RepID=UPI000380CCF3|nr:sigma-54-dependent Fis family transcriptional regulator [Aromatoleum toluclasticum]
MTKTAFHPALQNAVAARRAYFDQGHVPRNLIDEAIVRSWVRCAAADRSTFDPVDFEPVGRAQLRGLRDANHALLSAARTPLDNLAKAVSGAGYAVLLTNNNGYALAVGGSIDGRPDPMKMAFREGVDLSENMIGTSAMSCAISERRAIRVFGPEHFFSATNIFHCAAAPIIAPDGQLAGVVDITGESPFADPGALALVSQCAQSIEGELFRELPAHLTLSLSWQAGQSAGGLDMLIAFGPDGEVLAMNGAVRDFIGADGARTPMYFEDLFAGRFRDCVDTLARSRHAVALLINSGVRLFASRVGAPARGVIPARHGASSKDTRQTDPLPEFGDSRLTNQIEAAQKALANGLPVLVLGDTGSGKEVVAHSLHVRSRNAAGTLVALNCAAIPESLIESELFGHVEGAYTGARRGGMPGKIEQADGGTLFLDEIGDMPLHLQARLLRVLETREVTRLGGTTSRRINFQLVCATHQDIPGAIRGNRFRADLYYRINGFALTLAPLRSREDLPRLISALLSEMGNGTRQLSPTALDALLRYDWPGNTRELKHALCYADAMAAAGESLRPEHFPAEVIFGQRSQFDSTASKEGVLPLLEKDAIHRALQETSGNVRLAAEILGISRATLYRRLSKCRKFPSRGNN